MKWVGLTGGIATGKSTAAKALRARGAAVIDADELAREAVAPGSRGLAELVAEFGPEALGASGELDRRALGNVVFADPSKLKRLEAIVHPRVRAQCRERREALERAGQAIAFYDVPLLFEKGMAGEFDLTVAILCAPDAQKARLMARNGLTEAEARARISAQLPIAEKARLATVVLWNDGTIAELERKLDAFLATLAAR
jgi:dephospho-CoA kinase